MILIVFGGELIIGGDDEVVLLPFLGCLGELFVEDLHFLEDLLEGVPVGVGLVAVAALNAPQQQIGT